jgi:hypothetical protein
MLLEPGKSKRAPTEPRADRARDVREAAIEGADKTERQGSDLVHGDGGTLGLDDGEDLNKDD